MRARLGRDVTLLTLVRLTALVLSPLDYCNNVFAVPAKLRVAVADTQRAALTAPSRNSVIVCKMQSLGLQIASLCTKRWLDRPCAILPDWYADCSYP